MIGIDSSGRGLESNRQAEVAFGWMKDRSMGQELAALISRCWAHPDDALTAH